MIWIVYLFFGVLGFWMNYGNAVTGNELTLLVYTLGGFFTFWIVVFLKIWWIALLLIAAAIAGSYLAHLYEKNKIKKAMLARKRFQNI